MEGSLGVGFNGPEKLDFGLFTEYSHLIEKGTHKYWSCGHGTCSSPLEVYNCSQTLKNICLGISLSDKNVSGEVSAGNCFVGFEISKHCIIGGHFKIGYNVDVFFKELFK